MSTGEELIPELEALHVELETLRQEARADAIALQEELRRIDRAVVFGLILLAVIAFALVYGQESAQSWIGVAGILIALVAFFGWLVRGVKALGAALLRIVRR